MNLLGSTLEEVERELLEARDFMSLGVLKILGHVEGEIHEDGWDAHPRLFLCYRQLVPPEALEEVGMLDADMIMLAMREMAPGSLEGRSGKEISAMLTDFAHQPLTAALAEDREDIFGWALLNEGRVAVTWEDDELNPTGSKAPDEFEVRFMLAVDRAGLAYQLMRERDTGMRFVLRDDDTNTLHGGIVDALRALTEATT